MSPENLTESEQPLAIVLVEAKPGSGRIVIPGAKKTISLVEYRQTQNVTIPEHMVVYKEKTIRMGRDASNELILDIPNVSRYHAILTSSTSSLRVSDLKSTNGTFVNGNPVTTPVKLETGDIVEIGSAKLKIELLSDIDSKTNLQLVGTRFDPITTSCVVTVLVADIVGYTKLSELLPYEDVTRTLQSWFERMTQIIREYDGKVDKYIGDCVMAFWPGEDLNAKILAIEATRAAVELKKETRFFSESPDCLHGYAYDWDCRVSLNTGQAMIGTVGARGSRDFTVLGDTVNVAFHLNTVAGARGYDFVLGDTTAKHIDEIFKPIKLGPVELKGRRQKTIAYTLPETF
ncbi:FHA domain-containing protein [candidate division KSB1 bacterium]|nr:FHA domain-containing protein [candidate division KSB1 bacterium]